MTDRAYRWFKLAGNAMIVAGLAMFLVVVYRAYTDDCAERGGVRIQGACIDKAVLR